MTDIPTHPIQPEPDAEVPRAPFIDPQPQPPPPVVDPEQPTRGVKRKLAGWTAPADYDYSVVVHPPPPSQSQSQSQSYYHPQPQPQYLQMLPANPETNIPAAPFPPPPQQQRESNNEHDIKPTIPSLSPSPSLAAVPTPAPVPETTIKSEPLLPPVHTFASLAATPNPTPTSTTAALPPRPRPQPQTQTQTQTQQQHQPAPQPAKHAAAAAAARMGTRLPGSGDLGGSGPRKRLGWPRMGGVRVDASWKGRGLQGKVEDEEEEEDDEDEEEVLEEECYAWTDLPMNKQGFRYIPCGPSPSPAIDIIAAAGTSPPVPYPPFNRRIPAMCMPFGKSEDTTSYPPAALSTTNHTTGSQQQQQVHLDFLDRSTYLKISPSGLTCTAEKGFRSVRGNVGVRAGGGWYFECLVLKGGGEGKSGGLVVGALADTGGEGGGGGEAAVVTVNGKGKSVGVVSERFGLGPGRGVDHVETTKSGGNPAAAAAPTSTSTPTPTNHASHAQTQPPLPTTATATPSSSSSSSDGAHIRLGWARREAPLNGPCGLDGYSYGIRDATGEKVTISRPKAYAGKGFGTGDVVGCLIYFPDSQGEGDRDGQTGEQVRKEGGGRGGAPVREKDDEYDPSVVRRKRIPIRYKGQLYFESVEYSVPKEMEALVARDGRPVDPPVVGDVASAATTTTTATNGNGGGSGKQGKRSLSDSPVKKKKAVAGKAAAGGGGKGKQAGKAVRKKSAGSKRKRNNNDDDDDDFDDDSSQQDTTPKPRELARIPGSKISFFLNGKPMAAHPAFKDIFSFLPLRQTDAELATRAALSKKLGAVEASLRDRENYNDDGTLGYYPFISCFGGGKVQFHPGPEWMAPVDPKTWGLGVRVGKDGVQEPIVPRPLSERWQEYYAEEMAYDERDEKEVAELLRKEALSEAAKKRVKAEKSSGSSSTTTTGKPSKASVAKRATMAAALQASTPISRGSSAVPSMNGSIPASSNGPSVLLGTIIQDRGTPGGTPAPVTPVEPQFQFDQTQVEDARSSPPRTVTSASSPAPAPVPLEVNVRDPYALYQRDGTALSATSEDAPGEEDWSQEPEPVHGELLAVEDDDAPELPYGMGTPPPPPHSSVGQIQERVVNYQYEMQ